jgi:hypothetical protein
MYASNDTYQPIIYVPDLTWTCISSNARPLTLQMYGEARSEFIDGMLCVKE